MVKLGNKHRRAEWRATSDEGGASVSSRLHKPAAPCVRKRAAQRRRTGRSFEQLLLSGDTAAAACAEYLAGGPARAGAGVHGSSGDAAQEALGLLPDTPLKPGGQPRLLASCQSTRMLLSPRSRANMSSDAVAAHAGGNSPADSNELGAAPLPIAAAEAPLGAVAPPACAPAAALQAQQLAQEIEMQLAQQAQQAQQLAHDLEMQLVQQALLAQQARQAQQLSWGMQLAREVQAVWQAQQAHQASWGAPPTPLSDATQGPSNVWVVLCGSPPTPQQPVSPGAAPAPMPMSPHSAYSLQPSPPPAAVAPPQPSYFQQLGGELPQATCGPASLTPPSTPFAFGAPPSLNNAVAGSSPFAEGRPGLGSMGYGQPGTPRLMQLPALPPQPAADLTGRPMRPPPELMGLLSQLPPISPLACTGMQPPDGLCPFWQQAASLVQGLPASQAQPLLQPVERLPPPPPLPDARMLQSSFAGLPGGTAVGGGCACGPVGGLFELPGALDGQISEQLLLPFLDGDLLDLLDIA